MLFEPSVSAQMQYFVRKQENLMQPFIVQHNLFCPPAERDLAGEHAYQGFLGDAVMIFQTAPFFQPRFPLWLLWKCAALEPYIRNGTWDKWFQTQRKFCEVYREAEQALSHPLCASLGNHVGIRVALANKLLENKVQNKKKDIHCIVASLVA